MKTLTKVLSLQFKFFGKPKPFDSQSFDAKLVEFSDKAYASIPDEHNYPRARCLIDRGIDSIRNLLKNIWNMPEKVDKIKLPKIAVCMRIDNEYTAYFVEIMYFEDLNTPHYETDETSNFKEVIQAEKDEVIEKYGFTELPLKKYRVKFENHEAVLNELQVAELRKEYSGFYFDVVEVK